MSIRFSEFGDEMGTGKRSHRIVLIYQDRAMLELLEMIIGNLFTNVRLMEYESSVAAWEYLSRNSPHLLITAMRMPDLCADELIPQLARKKVTYPIIVLSGLSDTSWIKPYVNQGLNVKILVMPCEVATLQELLKTALTK